MTGIGFMWMPGLSASTMKLVMPSRPGPPVRAKTMPQRDSLAPEMQILVPLRI